MLRLEKAVYIAIIVIVLYIVTKLFNYYKIMSISIILFTRINSYFIYVQHKSIYLCTTTKKKSKILLINK